MKISKNLVKFFVFLLCLMGLSFYVFEIFSKWHFDPDIIVSEKYIPTHEIPMPAITICSPLMARKSMIDLTALQNNRSLYKGDESDECFPPLMQTCHLANTRKLKSLSKFIKPQNFASIIDKCSLNFDDFFSYCYYTVPKVVCGKLFNRVLSNHGICYSSNMLGINSIFNTEIISKDFESYRRENISKSWNPSDPLYEETFDDDIDEEKWSLDSGYLNSSATFPVRMFEESNFVLYFPMDLDDYSNLCFYRMKSFTIWLHLPNEMPTIFHDDISVKIEDMKNVKIAAKLITTDESLRSYTPEQRRCYFEGERKLKYFASYTKAQCEYECLTNYTHNKCGCVTFYLPHDNDTKICNMRKSMCAHDATTEIKNNLTSCNCLMPCNDIKYSVVDEKSSDFDYDSRSLFRNVQKNFHEKEGRNVSFTRFLIRRKSPQTVHQIRSVSYRIQDFIADCGGLGGLFLGFSLLSIVEFFQNVSKFFSSLRKKRNTRWAENSTITYPQNINSIAHANIIETVIDIEKDLEENDRKMRRIK